MDNEIEEADANDVRVSGIMLLIEKNSHIFEFTFENSTKVIELGKTDIISEGQLSGYKEAYAVQNEIFEIGRFLNGRMYENRVKICKNNMLEFESIAYFPLKKLKIKSIYLKQGN